MQICRSNRVPRFRPSDGNGGKHYYCAENVLRITVKHPCEMHCHIRLKTPAAPALRTVNSGLILQLL